MPSQGCLEVFELKKSKSRLQTLRENLDRNKYKRTQPQLEDFMRYNRITTNRETNDLGAFKETGQQISKPGDPKEYIIKYYNSKPKGEDSNVKSLSIDKLFYLTKDSL